MDCSKPRTTPVPQNSATGKFRKCCFPEIMPRLQNGAKNRDLSAHGKTGRICSDRSVTHGRVPLSGAKDSHTEVGSSNHLVHNKLRMGKSSSSARLKMPVEVVIEVFYPERHTR